MCMEMVYQLDYITVTPILNNNSRGPPLIVMRIELQVGAHLTPNVTNICIYSSHSHYIVIN